VWSCQLQTLGERLSHLILQEYTIPGRQITMATKFYAVMPNICGSSVWNFLLDVPSSAYESEVAAMVLEICGHITATPPRYSVRNARTEVPNLCSAEP